MNPFLQRDSSSFLWNVLLPESNMVDSFVVIVVVVCVCERKMEVLFVEE